ncbi:MAG: mechanosensitive ion channel family protein [Crocosphaera sp.]
MGLDITITENPNSEGILMIQSFTKFFALLLCIGMLVLGLIITEAVPTVAQNLPGLSLSSDEITTESYVPIFTRGNLDIAPIFLDGKIIGGVSSFIPLDSDEQESQSNSYGAATRSHLIHSKLQKILNNMSRYSKQVLPNQGIWQLEAQEKELKKQLVTNVSQQKGTAVVSITFPQDDVPEIVYSVTEADISRPRFGSSQALQVAEAAANIAENALIQAWRERQAPHLLAQTQQGLLILVALSVTSVSLGFVQKSLTIRQRKLKNSLSNAKPLQLHDDWMSGFSKVKKGLKTIVPQLEKLDLRQRYSFNAFYKAGLFWTQWLLWLLGIGYLTSLFYFTRSWSNWIVGVSVRGIRAETIVIGWPPRDWLLSLGRESTLGTPLVILLLLLTTRLTLTGGDAFCDFFAWYGSSSQSRQRHTLRATTLSRAFKGWLRASVYLFLGVTILYHLHQLGTVARAVAIFLGFLSFAFSLAAQDLLKDLIAGVLILWEDHYAVGDVIFIGDQGGLVEKITLRVTQLRNLDGELITIPNGSIGMVRNLSSEWSQVNYAIEVSYDADVDRVMEVMETVAQQLYDDPQWQEQILESPEILGIDNIAHTGILIRLLIKTQPLKQWSVAREFRRRLKKAFDYKGIEVGIPQQIEMYRNGDFSQSKIYRNNHQNIDS